MSGSKRRPRRRRDHDAQLQSAGPVAGAPTSAGIRPLAPWRWKTFPVYFAFSLGLFIGVYGGALGAFAASGDNGNSSFFLVISVVAAILLGFGLSRIVVRWMTVKRWVRPRGR